MYRLKTPAAEVTQALLIVIRRGYLQMKRLKDTTMRPSARLCCKIFKLIIIVSALAT